MTSIRNRTAALVALSMTVLLALGGFALHIVLSQAMISQFDDALRARAGALQSLTRFDGISVEMDFAGEAMPRYARPQSSFADAEYFVAWVRESDGWRVFEQSESLRGGTWPPVGVRDGPLSVRDLELPGASPRREGRAVLLEFAATSERDEEGNRHQQQPEQFATQGASPKSGPSVRLMVALSRDPLDRTLAIIGWCIACVSALLAIASIAVSRWAVARGLVPLGELSQRVQLLGSDTLGTRFDAAELPAELRPIAQQLSSLLARLEEAFDREKRFTAAASHELRTPIAELRMLLEVASSQRRTSDEWSRTAEIALGVLARAQALCETLLHLSRTEAKASLPDEDVRSNLCQVLADQAKRAVNTNGGDARRVEIRCRPELFVRIDEAALTSIIGNLLDNALRHGETTAEVPAMLVVTETAGSVQLEISNQAPGLDALDAPHLFEPFWRKDSSRYDRRGFGLGLAVARTLARAAGGDITAELDTSRTLTMRLTLTRSR